MRSGYATNESGRIKIASIVLIVLLAGAIYYGREVGGVFLRKMKLEDTIQLQLSRVGQIEDSAIRQRIQSAAQDMNLPPDAQRVGLIRTAVPRAIRITIIYAEPVNLLFMQTEIPVRIEVSRGF